MNVFYSKLCMIVYLPNDVCQQQYLFIKLTLKNIKSNQYLFPLSRNTSLSKKNLFVVKVIKFNYYLLNKYTLFTVIIFLWNVLINVIRHLVLHNFL